MRKIQHGSFSRSGKPLALDLGAGYKNVYMVTIYQAAASWFIPFSICVLYSAF